jgi:N-acetylglucosamine-6-sulfatase
MRLRNLLLVGLLSACAAAPETREPRRRPNIVFILSDDHAAQTLGAYGSTVARTPNLDRLAAEGLRFENAFCGNAICSPARASVLTGLHSHAHGVVDNAARFDGALPSFPKALDAAGYRTALVGKWHLKSDPTGFDHWEVFPDQGEYYDPRQAHRRRLHERSRHRPRARMARGAAQRRRAVSVVPEPQGAAPLVGAGAA